MTWPARLGAVALLAGVGLMASLALSPQAGRPGRVDVAPPAPQDVAEAHRQTLREQFNNATGLLQAQRFEEAATALQKVLALSPRLPEAHVNLGFALLGLGHASAARRSFEQAVDLRPEQANAYWGLAIALEQQGDLEAALGSMRTYLHLSPADDEARRARARSALWEWEARLGRHGDAASASGGLR